MGLTHFSFFLFYYSSPYQYYSAMCFILIHSLFVPLIFFCFFAFIFLSLVTLVLGFTLSLFSFVLCFWDVRSNLRARFKAHWKFSVSALDNHCGSPLWHNQVACFCVFVGYLPLLRGFTNFLIYVHFVFLEKNSTIS